MVNDTLTERRIHTQLTFRSTLVYLGSIEFCYRTDLKPSSYSWDVNKRIL